VDCPGHASLIRTIIGGAQIIDLMMLVVDVTKGIQTQTAGKIKKPPDSAILVFFLFFVCDFCCSRIYC
jgi:translation initiation factor IF-2